MSIEKGPQFSGKKIKSQDFQCKKINHAFFSLSFFFQIFCSYNNPIFSKELGIHLFFFPSMWHLKKHKTLTRNQTTNKETTASTKNETKMSTAKNCGSTKSKKAHVIMTGQSSTDTTSKKNASITAPARNLTACHATNS